MSVSFMRACSSICIWMSLRSAASTSSGMESISMRRRLAGLVHEVDGLVGQEAVGDVAVGQRRPPLTMAPSVMLHAVVDLVLLLQAAQDGDGVLHRRLARPAPAGSGAPGRRPSRCTCGTRPAWWRRCSCSSPRASMRLEHVASVHARRRRRAGAARWCAARR